MWRVWDNGVTAEPAIYGIFAAIIIQGAVLLALAAQALIERGREFSITDNGITFQPPAVAEMLNAQFTKNPSMILPLVSYKTANLMNLITNWT